MQSMARSVTFMHKAAAGITSPPVCSSNMILGLSVGLDEASGINPTTLNTGVKSGVGWGAVHIIVSNHEHVLI